MKKKQPNYRKHYSDEEHAIELFDSNSRCFEHINEPFDILPYSERYYSDNYECFTHRDRLEIGLFIRILIQKGYIEKAGNPYNIVTITELGKKRISDINERIAPNSMNRI
jgi:hypothetical protein